MYIDALKNCDKCKLRSKITGLLGKRHNEYHRFTFYYKQENVSKAKFLIIMQNPGFPKNKWYDGEYDDLLRANDNNVIDLHRKWLLVWLRKINPHFFTEFIKVLRSYNLINYDLTNDDIFDNSFLSDFIFTDLVKCRSTTADIDSFSIDCFNNYLKEELEMIGKNKLIFTFSTRTWEIIYKNYIGEDYSNDKKVTKVHGKVFYSAKLNSHFIPLVHFSQTQFNNYLRNSYFYYFSEGIEEYKRKLNGRTNS
jgi:hypothetical protein